MEWSLLLKAVFGLYILYYGVMLLLDFLKSKHTHAAASPNISYDIKDLIDKEDEPVRVNDKDFIVENDSRALNKELSKSIKPGKGTENGHNNDSTVEFIGPVAGQGIPSREFAEIIKKANAAVRY